MSQLMKVKIMNEKQPVKIKATSKFPPVNVGGATDHSKLENLDYAHSGHTGFASSEDIPTKVGQLENDKSYIDNSVSNLVNYELKGKTGTNLGVSIDNTTYVMTIDLKNTAGDVISTGSVDLPLESMVVGASYDDSTKEIVLTLQSGEEVKFSVADLVSGLVSQSTFDTKMNEISQEFNHKFDMPYYYKCNGGTDFEDTSETTLAMFNEIAEKWRNGEKPLLLVQGYSFFEHYSWYGISAPLHGSFDSDYLVFKFPSVYATQQGGKDYWGDLEISCKVNNTTDGIITEVITSQNKQFYTTRYDAVSSRNTNQVLTTDNTEAYTPKNDYNPAPKKYVDDKLTTITGYDATKTQTLKNINGVLTWQTDGE